jgi:uncharacterized protein with HEPN domain
LSKDAVFLRHILEEVDFLIAESKGLAFEQFVKNDVLKRASVRSLEVIGEAVKNLSGSVKQKCPYIDWKKFAGLRNKLIHHYFSVNWDIVWDVVKNKLPEPRDSIAKLLGELEKGGV